MKRMENHTMMEKTYVCKGGASLDLPDEHAESLFLQALGQALADVGLSAGKSGKVLILPPDITRLHSRAGFFTDIAFRELTSLGIEVTVMPALGTHIPLTDTELERMFPCTPRQFFRVHDWRNEVVELGRIEKEWVEKTTLGAVSYDWPVQVNKLLLEGGFSLIVSIGQVVPHESIGMANHAKNIFVGTGGKEAIDKSHFAGAVFGMERMLGRIDTPIRALFDEGMRRYGDKLPPILFVLTVVNARDETETANNPAAIRGSPALRGLYAGFGRECFVQAATLSRQVNINLLDAPIQKAVVYLDPEEFRTTWLGNKAIYRTRMAMATGGVLLIIAPGIERFGEDMGMDALIRRIGYRPGKEIQDMVKTDDELANNLVAAGHLIHGSNENRFTVRYCSGQGVSRKDIESVYYEWGDINEALTRYDINKLLMGWNILEDGEKIFFVPNPALGLWALNRL